MEKIDFETQAKRDFKNRFRELFDTSGCQYIAQFAKLLGMNRQNVDRYYNGDRTPDLPSIVQICKKMGVSADWLLKLSDVRTTDTNIKNVVDSLGIEEDAALVVAKQSQMHKEALSSLIIQPEFELLLDSYLDFLVSLTRINTDNFVNAVTLVNKNGEITLAAYESAIFFANMVSMKAHDLCAAAFNRFMNNFKKMCNEQGLDYEQLEKERANRHASFMNETGGVDDGNT